MIDLTGEDTGLPEQYEGPVVPEELREVPAQDLENLGKPLVSTEAEEGPDGDGERPSDRVSESGPPPQRSVVEAEVSPSEAAKEESHQPPATHSASASLTSGEPLQYSIR